LEILFLLFLLPLVEFSPQLTEKSQPEAPKLAKERIRPLEQPEARLPKVGEVIYVNCIVGATCPPAVGSSFSTAIVRGGRRAEGEQKNSPHLCIVHAVDVLDGDWSIKVFMARSYHEAVDSVKYVEKMDENEKKLNIPLPSPPSLPDLPALEKFGPPIAINVVFDKYSWLIARIRKIEMGPRGWVRSVPRMNLSKHSGLHDL
jgi:hypothetical protein